MENMEIKNILITGYCGYVGTNLIPYLTYNYPEYKFYGYDNSYFYLNNLNPSSNIENLLNYTYPYSDIRKFNKKILSDFKIDTIIHLAAISNDPISNKFEDLTKDINIKASYHLALLAKELGVKNFVFASSCSVYGYAEEGEVNEESKTNPLTPYAKSKLFIENSLLDLADSNFKVTCLRFATACGWSDRLRLDLVLNDFVASALVNKKIEIMSDGTPWRPLINTWDMARAINWAIHRDGNNYEIVNVGDFNYQVKELAQFVKEQLPETEIIINPNAVPDKRSYKVNFDKFRKLAPDYVPKITIQGSIHDLIKGLEHIKFDDKDFKKGELIRLNRLNNLKEKQLINDNLEWIK
jgi:nucleoside-diphosphate-sugar epimerase